MTDPRIVNVTRTVGHLTEPFIRQRVSVVPRDTANEVWYERSIGPKPDGSRHMAIPIIGPGSIGDRVFHRWPGIGPPLASAYRDAELLTRPRSIYAHFATTGYLVGSVTQAPLVVSAYGFDVSVLPRQRLWRSAYKELADRASMVLVEGPFMRDRVVELGFRADCVRIVRIAAELQDIEYRDPPPIDQRPIRMLACGRFVEKKGHGIAIEAFANVRTSLPIGSSLEIVGSGPLVRPLLQLAARLRVDDAVTLPECFRVRIFIGASRPLTCSWPRR